VEKFVKRIVKKGEGKTVFFTVLKSQDEKSRCKIILDILAKRFGASTLELRHFNPQKDGGEITEYVALFEPSLMQFHGRIQRVGPNAPGLPVWAIQAKDRMLIGPKAVKPLGNAHDCAREIFDKFPWDYVPPELRNDQFRNRRPRIHER
jgi:hypothetical protein